MELTNQKRPNFSINSNQYLTLKSYLFRSASGFPSLVISFFEKTENKFLVNCPT